MSKATWTAQRLGDDGEASYLMGDTPILMLAQGDAPTVSRDDALAALIEGNLDHPARELMWGAPGTLLAALLLHERNSSDARWAAAPRLLMQFCHGAPGFVICLADMPGAELDALLIAAGEATWAAGPLAKGSNLCHGTGGNGYALLKLFERTGDARWLERARAFAMHAIAQMQADEQQVGQLRYSLWTGDPGLAIYLWDCLRSRAAFPTLDVFYS